jgi:ABC-type glutathione transport system ATPase component
MTEPTRRPLTMKGLRIEGRADEEWLEIVKGVDLTLHKGEVLGLIGESGAGKSTIGLAAMGFARDGCRISGGEIDCSTGSTCAPPPRPDGACAASASPMSRSRRRPASTPRTS